MNPFDIQPKNNTIFDDIYVVTMISNPVRYRSRYEIYRKWITAMTEAGVRVVTAEVAFGDRPFEVTERDNPMHLQYRTIDELWHKENVLNLAINYVMQIDPCAKYIAWIDADVLPMRPIKEWIQETVHQLQHNHFVQMFEAAYDLDPKQNVIGQPQRSFFSQYVKSGYKKPNRGGFWNDYYTNAHGHPGFCFAATVEGLRAVGGLIDFAILGAADRHMCLGLIGCMDQSFESKNDTYIKKLLQWQERCERWIKRDVGYVSGSIYHYWHGKKGARGYTSRWKILVDNKYNPDTDIKPDHQGILQLETWDDRQIMLRDQIRSYFKSRSEDSIDV